MSFGDSTGRSWKMKGLNAPWFTPTEKYNDSEGGGDEKRTLIQRAIDHCIYVSLMIGGLSKHIMPPLLLFYSVDV